MSNRKPTFAERAAAIGARMTTKYRSEHGAAAAEAAADLDRARAAQAAIDACCAAVEARGYTVPPGHCGVDLESGTAYACSGATAGPGTYHDSALTVQSRREPDGTWSAPY